MRCDLNVYFIVIQTVGEGVLVTNNIFRLSKNITLPQKHRIPSQNKKKLQEKKVFKDAKGE